MVEWQTQEKLRERRNNLKSLQLGVQLPLRVLYKNKTLRHLRMYHVEKGTNTDVKDRKQNLLKNHD